ncbi:two component transcriptional regulator, LuxR family [Filimonas lacunae]|uniref:Two component transcriptional regulator, LuxR family n=1 Tax=Filimonas lacunae TaxID=477680 RepID=A0A173MPW0_9BACT|nr:response regulator transcription factor [Filimonas lacunae]BAV09526.1 two-component transcriptional regulator, LuxR family [Filimonas lacunae]SIS74655.1 two component transcriptional regulator, LuxR family [Filimonas lacunae]
MSISLFIVDDHYMVIEGIQSLLRNEKNIELRGHATNASSCLAFLKQDLPDVILMDINLPGISGIDLCREVKALYPAVAIIGLSTFNQLSFIEKMLENGALGYIIKNATREELLAAIKAAHAGKTYLHKTVADVLRASKKNKLPTLTRREKEVLELIANGLTNNEIGEKLFLSSGTVDTYRKNLLVKLNAKNTAELVKLALVKKLIPFTDG